MNIQSEMAKARRVAVQRKRIPLEFILNPPAFALYHKQREKMDHIHVFAEKIVVISNKQNTPTVGLRCRGELHPIDAH